MVIPVHPAPGLGDLLPGWFVVPQNPIKGASTPVVATVTAKAGGSVVKVPSMGDLLPGMFVVPQNPLKQALASPPGSGVPGTKAPQAPGMGCFSCGLGQTTTPGGGLMGSLSSATSGITGWLTQSSIAGLPNWALVGGGLAALFLLMPSGSEYQAARSHARGYRRLARAMAT